MSAAQNCPASQRALKNPPWGEFQCSHGIFCFMTGAGLSCSGQTSLNQDSAGTGTAVALTPTAFSYTFSVSKGRLKSSVAAKSSAEEGTEGLEERRTHKLNSWRELLWYYRKCYFIICVEFPHHGQFCLSMVHGEEGQGWRSEVPLTPLWIPFPSEHFKELSNFQVSCFHVLSPSLIKFCLIIAFAHLRFSWQCCSASLLLGPRNLVNQQ